MLRFLGQLLVGLMSFKLDEELDTDVVEIGFAQLCIGGPLASWVGRLWALRISISVMIIGV